ncbi:hypothetical protein NQ315_007318 [Exocentrus adspersus]|uniref:Tubulin epsilon and delta complex protein 1 domain-containing protein n=1 Tax=Exocentrus adspersus TaxID=1586481 RepID=A0AAV8WCW0_9CUCU|nr:hypothetical protein NQ315_007318 [Exocentrus adspersus]
MSSEIKHVIGLLCKQLNMILDLNLKPEHFRLAKFDKNDENVIPLLWTTLSLLTVKDKHPDFNKIKNHMKTLNHTSEMFYCLPEDGSTGSRELLIAIAFIVAKNLPNLINEEIKYSPLDDYCSLIDAQNIQVSIPQVPDCMDKDSMKNYIMWLKGKTQQNNRMTEEYKNQTTKIYEKLNGLLNIKSRGKLSLNEVLALSSSKYSKEFLEKNCAYHRPVGLLSGMDQERKSVLEVDGKSEYSVYKNIFV